MNVCPVIAVEGAVDHFCGRPYDRNPYCRVTATVEWQSWNLGWTEAAQFLADRGQEEASRWLREAA